MCKQLRNCPLPLQRTADLWTADWTTLKAYERTAAAWAMLFPVDIAKSGYFTSVYKRKSVKQNNNQ